MGQTKKQNNDSVKDIMFFVYNKLKSLTGKTRRLLIVFSCFFFRAAAGRAAGQPQRQHRLCKKFWDFDRFREAFVVIFGKLQKY